LLFDKEDYIFESDFITYVHHVRIKIFTNAAINEANVPLYGSDDTRITDFKAEAINLDGKTIKYIPLSEDEFHKQKINSSIKAIKIAFPDVHPGSVVEYQYRRKLDLIGFTYTLLFDDE